jgi:hypothetical protein
LTHFAGDPACSTLLGDAREAVMSARPSPSRPDRRQAARRRWLALGGLSLLFHGLLGWTLLNTVPAPPVLVEPRSVMIQLLSPDRPLPSERAAVSSVRSAPLHIPTPRAPTPRDSSSAATSPSRPGAPGEIVAPPGFTARGSLTGGGEALREAARKSGCTEADIVKLTKAERETCAEALGAKNKNGPALYAAIDPDRKAAFDGDCRKDDDWCLYRTGKGPYPGLFALGKKRKTKGWD